VLDKTIRIVAVAACVLVALGFLLFAVDDLSSASQRQVAAVVSAPSSQEQARDRGHGSARRFIDDADDVLLSPFAGVTASSHDSWAIRGVPTLLALLAYGLGLGFLANWIRSRA
jgi:hypothetical protein